MATPNLPDPFAVIESNESQPPPDALIKFENGKLVIPKALTVDIAREMWARLDAAINAAQQGKADLILAVYNRFGEDAAKEIAGDTSYAHRLVSIARNTQEIRESHPALPMSVLAELAPFSDEPKKQAEGAKLAEEEGWNSVMTRAWLHGKTEEEAHLDMALQSFQRSLGVLATNRDYLDKARNLLISADPDLRRALDSRQPTK